MIDKIKNWFARNGKRVLEVCLIVFLLILLFIIAFILRNKNYDKIRIFFNSNIGNTITNSLISLIGVLITGLWGNQRLERLKSVYNTKQESYRIVKELCDKITFEYVEYFVTPTHYLQLREQFKKFQLDFEEKIELNSLIIPDRIYGELINTVYSMDNFVKRKYALKEFQKNHAGPEYGIYEEKLDKSKKEVQKQYKKLIKLIRKTYNIFNG